MGGGGGGWVGRILAKCRKSRLIAILKKIPHARNEAVTNDFASNCFTIWANEPESFSHRCIGFLKCRNFKWRIFWWRILKWYIFLWRIFALERKNTTCGKIPPAGIELTTYDSMNIRLIIWPVNATNFSHTYMLKYNLMVRRFVPQTIFLPLGFRGSLTYPATERLVMWNTMVENCMKT